MSEEITISHQPKKRDLSSEIKSMKWRKPFTEEELRNLKEMVSLPGELVLSDDEARRLVFQIFFYRERLELVQKHAEILDNERRELYREVCNLKGLCPFNPKTQCKKAVNCTGESCSQIDPFPSQDLPGRSPFGARFNWNEAADISEGCSD